jgi:hypothetical protein
LKMMDAESGTVHRVLGTAANVNDVFGALAAWRIRQVVF